MSQSNIPKLEDLPCLPRPGLIEAWEELFGRPPPKKTSRELLTHAIAWEIQARRHGGLKPRVQRRLERLARELKTGQMSPDSTPRFRPGTRLVREWQGEAHRVSVLEDGFEYRDTRYASLSKIAREITGTRWSGPAFFGLRKTSPGSREVNHAN